MNNEKKTIALTGGTLIDGNGGAPLVGATVLIVGNRIQSVGPNTSIQLPPGTETIDCRGKFVLPGLVDSHVHVGTSGGGLADPEEFKPATLAANLKTFLAFGVTSIMDMGGNPHLGKLAGDLESGALTGPRLFGARYGITAPGSHPMGLLRELRALDKIGSHFAEVDTPEAARALVRKVAAEKPAGLKIYHSRTEFPGTMCLDCNREKLKPEVLSALVEEGHAQGLRIFAHIAWPSEAREVIEAGVDVLSHPITHAESGVEPVLEMMAARGARIQSTMTRIEAYFALKAQPLLRDLLRGKVSDTVLNSYSLQNSVIRARHLTPGVTEDARRILEITMANLRRANRMGVEIVLGTDSGGPGGLHGAGVPREMELLNDCGLTPMQVIMASTRGAARVIGQGENLGTVEAGKLADILIIDHDPIQNINNIKYLSSVFRGGKRIDPNALAINGQDAAQAAVA